MASRSAAGWLRISLLTLLAIMALLTVTVGYCLLNPNTLKPLAHYLTREFTGRTLLISGDLELDLSLQPRARARDVSLGNADWSENPEMVVADYVDVQIDLGALLERRVHLIHLEAHGMSLWLEDRVDGRPNWVFFDDENEETTSVWGFMIEGLRLIDSGIYATIGDLEPIDLQIPELTEISDSSGNLVLAGSGTLNGDPWRVEGSVGTLDELLIAGNITLDLDLEVDDVDLVVAGSIGELSTLSNLDLTLSIYGPDADVFGEIFRMPEAFAGDVALTASVSPVDIGHALQMTGNIAAFLVETEGTVRDLNALDGWDGNFDLKGPDAGVFGKSLQIRGLPEGPFEVSGRMHLHGGDVDLTDVEIITENATLTLNADFEAFPQREGAFLNLRLNGADISQFRELTRVPTLPAAPFELNLIVDATGDEVLESSLTVGNHQLRAAGPVGEFPTYAGTQLATTLQGEDIAEILRLAGIEDTLIGRYQAAGTISISDSGLTVSNVTASSGTFNLTGEVDLPEFSSLRHFMVSGTLDVDDLQQAGIAFGLDDLPAERLAVKASVSSTDKGFKLLESTFDFEGTQVEAAGDLGTLAGLAGVDLRISAQGSNIQNVFEDALPGEETPFTLISRIVGADQAIDIIGLELSGEGGSFNLDATVTLADNFVGSHFSVSGRGHNLAGLVPSFPNYKPPQEPWEVSAEVSLPDAKHLEVEQSNLRVGSIVISVAGTLDTEDQSATSLVFEATGDSTNEIGQIGYVPWPDLPFSISTKLDGTTNAINVTRLEAGWGESDISASGSINLTGRPLIVLRGRSSHMNLIDLHKTIFGEQEDLEPEDDQIRFFPDTSIFLPELTALDYDADIDIQIDQFRGMRASLDDIDLKLVYKDEVLSLERAAYRDDVGSFNATGVLRTEGDQGYLELVLTGDDADFGFLTSSELARETVPRYSLDVSVSGQGATVAELAGNMSGKILVYSDGGQINNALLDAFAGDFLVNVLEVLNPFVTTEQFTPMECMVINATIDDGKVKLEPGFVMRTDRVNMFVYGNLNLKSERLDLSLATQARRGIGISAASITNPYFKVGGTLASPALQLDPASAAVAASVATATAGLSIVIRGLWDRLMGAQNPCPQFLNYQPKKSKDAESGSEG